MSCCNAGCVDSRKMHPPHLFQLDHHFGTEDVPMQLPLAKKTKT